MTTNIYYQQILEFLSVKKDDEKIKNYLDSESDKIILSSLKKTQPDSSDLETIIKGNFYFIIYKFFYFYILLYISFLIFIFYYIF